MNVRDQRLALAVLIGAISISLAETAVEMAGVRRGVLSWAAAALILACSMWLALLALARWYRPRG